ncbi:MAG TPA: ABC transporter permease [Myxococcales bacterium]|jgi:ABC-2 type transport system permease protein|nr:ABC transporter permease [Myxococcales bacterium]
MSPGTLKAFPTLLRVGFADALAYRAEFLVWILSTNMPLVMLALWSAVAREHPIGGFGQAEFVAYYLSALIVRLLTGAWVAWEINYELRQGLLAFRLLRPINPLIHFAAENMAALPLRALFALPIAAVSLWAMGAKMVTHDPALLGLFVVAVYGAWAINFLAQAIIGTLGFYVEYSISLWQIWFGLYMLLSGYLIPLALFPGWLLAAARLLPFRYMLSFPVEVILGQHDRLQALEGLGIQWSIVAAMGLLLAAFWKAGMRRFVAYGG